MHSHSHGPPSSHGQEKTRAALVSILASAGLVITKFAVAVITGSLALMVEALHSLMDLGATVITLFAVRWSDRPADGTHHYGHGKIESLAALFEVALLFVLAVYAVYEGVSRLVGNSAGEVSAPPIAIAILLLSVIIDFFRARALAAVAAKTSSQALEADSLHFTSDMMASIAALCGLIGIAAGFPKADAIAALCVAAMIVWISYGLFFRAIKTLLDEAPQGSKDRIERLAAEVAGVTRVARVRVREVGVTLFCEIAVDVPRALPLQRVDDIRQQILQKVRDGVSNADVSVLIQPVALEDETVMERVLLIAARQRCFVHHITVQQTAERLAIGLDLELDETMSLAKAHEAATKLELAITDEFGIETEVETHIEPLENYSDVQTADEVERAAIERKVQDLAAGNLSLSNIHSLRLRNTRAGRIVILHCQCPPHLSVREVHDAVDALERQLRLTTPDIARILIHAEPENLPQHHHEGLT